MRGKQKVQDFLRLLDPQSLPDAYHHLISLFDSRDTTSLYTADFRSSLNGHHLTNPSPRALASDAPFLNRIIDLQFRDWLPEDILMKQDKLSMASGIEVRVPFLDYQLVEYLLRVPPRLKIRGASNKHLLRAYAARYLPASAVDRRKMPFYVPLENFLGHARFRDLVEDTLGDRTVRSAGSSSPKRCAASATRCCMGSFWWRSRCSVWSCWNCGAEWRWIGGEKRSASRPEAEEHERLDRLSVLQ